jgi:DNA (cytosine-5)-methyltransferase 1
MLVTHALRGEGFDASEDGTGRGTPLVPALWSIRPSNSNTDYNARQNDHAQALTSAGNRPSARGGDLITFDCKASGQNGFGVGEIAGTQRLMGHANSHTNGGGHQAAMIGSAVRRLTPRECERLQGFPDDYTLINHRGKPAADGPRYKALGNSMAVPVMAWIGQRITQVSMDKGSE